MKKKLFVLLSLSGIFTRFQAQEPTYSQAVVEGQTTVVTITESSSTAKVNPMIYGQMLEDCNDAVIYGGVVNNEGKENEKVIDLLKPLNIPVMRWPAGTAIYDYDWRKGIGPIDKRVAEKEHVWGGMEYYTFGTDEFLAWCKKIGTEPYINICMGNSTVREVTLDDAVDWVEYVNGPRTSQMGALRAANGHPDPYNVRFWCIGNENYLGVSVHKAETAEYYGEQLAVWSKMLKCVDPNLSLLGVGRTTAWNRKVLARSGEQLDYLTLHYYITAQVNDCKLQNPERTLFAPVRVEENLKMNIDLLKSYNKNAGRDDNPIRFSIDEWNNRHSVYNGSGYTFSRKDDRRIYDVASTASMLNVFLRNSPYVAMANYIFPVNGHGLLKTVGEDDAYKSCSYYVFDLYRRFMKGNTISLKVEGPGLESVRLGDMRVEGDNETLVDNLRPNLCYLDCAATIDEDENICISFVNRSYTQSQTVSLVIPEGYDVVEKWSVESDDVTAANSADNRNNVIARQAETPSADFNIKPCGLAIVRCAQKGAM